MNISSIANNLALTSKDINANNTVAQNDNTFENLLKGAVKEVNQTQVDGYNAMKGIATGDVKNIQEAVQKIEEAELSLKLALEVKNKALGAYKEIMRMQV